MHEFVGDPDRVVGVLPADGAIGFAVEVALESGRYESARFRLFAHFPLDEVDDLGMVHVEANHLGSSAGGASTLGCACGSVEDLEEAHEAA